MNTHGNIFKITTFGESHGTALGVVIDGFPANYKIDLDNIKKELIRRKPGQNHLTTQRKENDEEFEILSGIFEGRSTGHPITIIIKNSDQKSKDYENLRNIYRPNHADLTYELKYSIRDHRGGGRSSGRETVSRVIAGALAKQILKEKFNIEIYAFTKQIGNFKATNINYDYIEQNPLRTGDKKIGEEMTKYVEKIAKEGNTIGGIVECHVINPPKGLGEPVFGKIKSILASSMLSIGGVLGFEYGAGFDIVNTTGIDLNEGFITKDNKIISPNNKYSGILGGITTGENISFRVAVKPTSSIRKKQTTVNKSGELEDFIIEGRHDPTILPRIIPVIEAMTAIDLLDLIMLDKAKKI